MTSCFVVCLFVLQDLHIIEICFCPCGLRKLLKMCTLKFENLKGNTEVQISVSAKSNHTKPCDFPVLSSDFGSGTICKFHIIISLLFQIYSFQKASRCQVKTHCFCCFSFVFHFKPQPEVRYCGAQACGLN